tara:strand:- start:5028 stop:5735 length:708 start_codon:yes stop_codon:yes gene_type:complete
MLNKIPNIFHKSGGLFYHYIALKYKKSLWESLRVIFNLELQKRKMSNVVLIGPSAGYLLDPSNIHSFKKVHCWEPDPSAHPFLKRKLKQHANFHIHKESVPFHEPELFRHTLRNFELSPNETLLVFCNILGQWDWNGGPIAEKSIQFMTTLDAYNQLSVHEEYSTDINPKQRSTKDSLPASFDQLKNLSRSGIIQDHNTVDLFSPEEKSEPFWWTITPRQLHLMVCGFKKGTYNE